MNNKIEEIIRDEEAVWEQRKLGDILISLQNNTLSRADLSNEAGVAKNVHYGDVLIKFGEVLDVSKEKLPMISDESVLSKYKSSFLQNGDVIVADTAEDSTVGKCSEIAGLNDEVVLSGLHTIPYRPIEKFASGYLGYYLNSSAYHNQLIPLMQGIKVASISKSAMQDTDIVYPKSVKEQGKIGDYFQSLDHLITLHQRISLYFLKINTFVWEQRKFGELVTIERGGSPRPIDKFITNDENGLNWVKIGDAPEHGNYITQTKEKIRPLIIWQESRVMHMIMISCLINRSYHFSGIRFVHLQIIHAVFHAFFIWSINIDSEQICFICQYEIGATSYDDAGFSFCKKFYDIFLCLEKFIL